MATQASLDGISKFGIHWRAIVKINLIDDIPAAFVETETMIDMIVLAHNICTNLIKSLKNVDWEKEWNAPDHLIIINEPGVEEEPSYLDSMKYRIDNWLQELEETFVIEDLDQLQGYDQNYLLSACDGLEDELIYRLNELYDWADFWRVCLSPIR